MPTTMISHECSLFHRISARNERESDMFEQKIQPRVDLVSCGALEIIQDHVSRSNRARSPPRALKYIKCPEIILSQL